MTIDVEQALAYKLLNTVAVAALVGTRVHPLRLPDQAVLPAVVYSQVSAAIRASHDESAANALTNARYQVDAWAETYTGAVALGKTVFEALHGFKGVITSGIDSFTIQSCLRVDRRANNDAETALYWISQDFMIWY